VKKNDRPMPTIVVAGATGSLGGRIAMTKKPSDRVQSAAELAQALIHLK
jgi:hypothetical protein